MSDLPEIFQKLAARLPEGCTKFVQYTNKKTGKKSRGYTSIDAYHVVARLTNTLGMMGDKWGVKDIREVGDDCVKGTFWYLPRINDSHICEFECYGYGSAGGDGFEIYKKALTNLISKASSYIGVGFSIYQGKHEDSPYYDGGDEGDDVKKKPAPNPSNADSSKQTVKATGGQMPSTTKKAVDHNRKVSNGSITPQTIRDEAWGFMPDSIRSKMEKKDFGKLLCDALGVSVEAIKALPKERLVELKFDLYKKKEQLIVHITKALEEKK